MTYLEWGGTDLPPCADDKCLHPKSGLSHGDPCALNRIELIEPRNPALATGRITLETLADVRQALPSAEWLRECMGQWEEPAEPEDFRLDLTTWAGMGEPSTDALTPVAFGVTVYPDRAWAAIALAGHRSDGTVQVELVAEGRGVRWPLDWLTSRIPVWQPCAVVLDGTALPLAPQLEEFGLEPVTTTSTTRAQASLGFYDDFMAGRLRHPGDPTFDLSVETAVRPHGPRRLWPADDPRAAAQHTMGCRARGGRSRRGTRRKSRLHRSDQAHIAHARESSDPFSDHLRCCRRPYRTLAIRPVRRFASRRPSGAHDL